MAKFEVKARILLATLMLSLMGVAQAQPTAVGTPPPINTVEDSAPTLDMAPYFGVIGPAVLVGYNVTGWTNPAIDNAVMVGSTLTITLLQDQIGTGTITVEAVDDGGLTEDQVVSITVTNTNDQPQAVGSLTLTPDEDENAPADTPAVDITVLFNDPDIGDDLTYTVISNSNPAVVLSASVNPSDELEWALVPDRNNELGLSVITIEARDLAGASITNTVTFDVQPLNDAPTPVGSLTVTVDEDEDAPADRPPADITPLFTDIDTGDVLTYSVPIISNSAIASATVNASGELEWTLVPDAFEDGSVTIEARDLAGATSQNTVTFNVRAVNDAPVPVGTLTITPNEDEDAPADTPAVDITGLFSDVDVGDTLTYTVINNANPAVASASVNPSGELEWVLVDDANDIGDITIRASDLVGATTTNTVTIDVQAVNDPPIPVGSLTITPNEDQNAPADTPAVDITGLFTDIDAGDSLTYSVLGVANAAVANATINGDDELEWTLVPDAFADGFIAIEARDASGATTLTNVTFNVQSVNDAPVIIGGISDIDVNEDDGPIVVLTNAFDDVDIATNGDVLTLSADDNDNPGLVDSITFNGEEMTIVLAEHQFGVANIGVYATDALGGPFGGSVGPVTFTLTVDSVDDAVDAQDDGLAAAGVTEALEDGGELTFDVLANDDIPEGPGEIISVGDPGLYYFIDGNGDTQSVVAAEVEIDPTKTQVIVTPAENFFGRLMISYTVQDSDSVDAEQDTAYIDFVVTEVNDVPVAANLREYTTFENAILSVSEENGLLQGAFDIDEAAIDADGNKILTTHELTVEFTSQPPVDDGQLISTADDGSFIFQPATNFNGVTSFTYQIRDNTSISEVGTVQIYVTALPEAGDPPIPGEVSVTFNLANVPLEQMAAVPPNVLVTMDDSGSMDWNFSMDLSDEQGRFPITNSSVATSSVRSRVYSYLWDLPTNTYSTGSSCCGRILPDEDSLDPDNDYAVWRGRSPAFNAIYYNPEVRYEPWKGRDLLNLEFADADPENIRLDPTSAANLFDITDPHDYRTTSVPNWDDDGGSTSFDVVGLHIPTYYKADGTKVEIRLANEPFDGGTEREDCANPNSCTYEEEIQNFANWFQYYRSRGHVAKAAVGGVVADLQDIRVGYETINRNVHQEISDLNEYYWEGAKRLLLDTIYDVPNVGGTPLRRAMHDAGRILSCTYGSSRDCPALPYPEGQCQQNYALLFTDGYWNGSGTLTGNYDQDGIGEWDGGRYADSFSNTVADVAMYYYENDIFPDVVDGVPVASSDIAGAPDGTFSSGSDTMHQHVKTFTIAFGVEGNIDSDDAFATDPETAIPWQNPNNTPEAKTDDMLHAALNGRGRFLNAGNPQELQTAVETAFLEFTQAASSTSAAAFNSTSLREGTLLYRGFYDLRNRTGELTATEVSTAGDLALTPTWKAAELLDATHPDGVLPNSRVITTYNPDTGNGTPFRHSNLTAAQQATLSNNEVNFLRGERTSEVPDGSLRARLETEGLLGDIVNSSPVFVGPPRAVGRDQAPFPHDEDAGELYSDFVDDQKNRTPVVYVGSNDGMLHGFNAETGKEVFGYVPNLVIDSTERFNNQLDNFTSTFYLHDFYVDLTPRFNDAWVVGSGSSRDWRTILIGGLGAGGKGFYALDVTNPATDFASEATASDAVLWEFTEDDDVYPLNADGDPVSDGDNVDPDGLPVKDLGYSLSLPSVGMTNAASGGYQDWAAIFGNGPNSTSGIATLFVLFLDGGTDGAWGSGDFVKVSTHTGVPLTGPLTGYPNGLGTPTLLDSNLDGTVDYAYAGDRLGNLWRFNLNDADTSQWKAVRVFTAEFSGMPQAILNKPLVTKHPSKPGFLISFGTGSFITEEDGENTDIQSIYTIWDELGDSPPTAQSDTISLRLIQNSIENIVDDSGTEIQTRRVITRTDTLEDDVPYQSETAVPGTYGWYMHLNPERAEFTTSGAPNPDVAGNDTGPQYPGEKAIRRFLFRDGVIITTTVLPATNETSCFGARPGSIMVMDALNGTSPTEAVIDFNRDGKIDEDDLINGYAGGLLFDYTDLDGALVDLSTLGGEGDTDFLFVSGGNDTVSYRIRDLNDPKTGRLSWTQLFN